MGAYLRRSRCSCFRPQWSLESLRVQQNDTPCEREGLPAGAELAPGVPRRKSFPKKCLRRRWRAGNGFALQWHALCNRHNPSEGPCTASPSQGHRLLRPREGRNGFVGRSTRKVNVGKGDGTQRSPLLFTVRPDGAARKGLDGGGAANHDKLVNLERLGGRDRVVWGSDRLICVLFDIFPCFHFP